MKFDEILFTRFFEDWKYLNPEKILSLIKCKSKIILTEEELKTLLNSKNKLKVKFGIDPTAKDIHIGHIVPILILNIFIKTGHIIDFVIGDFTALIGDPSGRSQERKALSTNHIKENMSTYISQISKYIDISKIKIHNNSEWLNSISLSELFKTLQTINLAQAIQRDDFRERLQKGGISLAEVCYACLMGIDSVKLKSDIEVGGIDQLLNFQQCKSIMSANNLKEELIITSPILEGTSGDGRKMSKSYNNYIAVNTPASDKFGKIMSLPDNLLMQYYKSFGYLFEEELDELSNFIKNQPLEAKKQLATYLVAIESKSLEIAKNVRKDFERKFSKKELNISDFIKLKVNDSSEKLLEVLFSSGKFTSKSELRRLFKQNSIRDISNDVIFNENSIVGNCKKIKVGKKLYFYLEILKI